MGIGMALFAVSRRKAGWSENRITEFFLLRGVFLILLQLFVENPAWRFGDLFMTPGAMTFRGGVPGTGSGEDLYLGVLFALGGAMVFWALMRRSSSPVIALISLAAILATQWVTPDRNHVSFPYSPFLRILIIPGYTNGWTVFYPPDSLVGGNRTGTAFWTLVTSKTFESRTDRGMGRSGLSDPFHSCPKHRDFRKPERRAAWMDGFPQRSEISAQPLFPGYYTGYQFCVDSRMDAA